MLPEQLDWKHALAAVVGILLVVFVASAVSAMYTDLLPHRGEAAIIKLDGAISSETGVRSQGISPEKIREMTKKATDSGADVLIYEINSPGGAVVASKSAARVVDNVEVPTVCWLKDMAASGGYWIAASCDRIVADSLTMTGSIGVTSAYLEFSDLLEQYGVEYVNLTSAEYKDMGSRYKNLTDGERAKFNRILNGVHNEFVQHIVENRPMNRSEVEQVATGEVILGKDAKDAGLVDDLGSRETAMAAAKNMTNTSQLSKTEYSPPQQFDFASLLFSHIGQGIAEGLKGEEDARIEARVRR